MLEVTSLRNRCAQIERFRTGLLAAVHDRGRKGELIRKAGFMSIVRSGGVVRPGDPNLVALPLPPQLLLERIWAVVRRAWDANKVGMPSKSSGLPPVQTRALRSAPDKGDDRD